MCPEYNAPSWYDELQRGDNIPYPNDHMGSILRGARVEVKKQNLALSLSTQFGITRSASLQCSKVHCTSFDNCAPVPDDNYIDATRPVTPVAICVYPRSYRNQMFWFPKSKFFEFVASEVLAEIFLCRAGKGRSQRDAIKIVLPDVFEFIYCLIQSLNCFDFTGMSVCWTDSIQQFSLQPTFLWLIHSIH